MVVPGDYNGAEGFLVACDRRAVTLPSWSVVMSVETKPLTAGIGKYSTGILYGHSNIVIIRDQRDVYMLCALAVGSTRYIKCS